MGWIKSRWSELQLRVNFPPSSTLLSSLLYEGYIFIKSRCGDQPTLDCVKSSWEEVEKSNINFNFIGDDIRYTKYTLKKLCGNDKVTNLKSLAVCLSKSDQYTKGLTSMEVDLKVKGKGGFLVGTNNFIQGSNGKEGYSFQIMKVDRYKGISIMESDLMNEQVTLYTDIPGLTLFLLGLTSAYVSFVDGNYYLLTFSEDVLPLVLESPTNWISIKSELSSSLSDVLNQLRGLDDELVMLSVLLNEVVIEKLRSFPLSNVNLRLLKVASEGKTYKIYEEFPLQIFKRWSLGKGFMESLQSLFHQLLRPASLYLRRRDKNGDGYHAYMALRYLYSYVITSNGEHLTKCLREIHAAHEINKSGGYLSWVSSNIFKK